MGASSAVSAGKRNEEPRTLARRLQGDLDWITLKALEKDRGRRYATASEFAADLQRYLRNEAVVAGPASAAYRLRKYAVRHRFGLGAAALVAILLIAFAATQTIQLRRIQRERDRANRVTDFMTQMFKVVDPNEARGNTITAREVLDKASRDIDAGLAQDPELQAQLLHTMGNVHMSLGLFSIAEKQFNRTIDIRRSVLGANHIDTLKSMERLALTLYRRGKYADAEALARETLDAARRLFGTDHPTTLAAQTGFGLILLAQGKRDEAERVDREVIAIEQRVFGRDAPQTLTTTNNLAMVLRLRGRYPEAEQAFRQVYEGRKRVLGADDPDTLTAGVNLALVLADQGRFPEAEALNRETLQQLIRVLGPEHPFTLNTMNNLADVLISEGKYPEAEKLNRDALASRERLLGPEHADTIISMANLARLLASDGRARESGRSDYASAGEAEEGAWAGTPGYDHDDGRFGRGARTGEEVRGGGKSRAGRVGDRPARPGRQGSHHGDSSLQPRCGAGHSKSDGRSDHAVESSHRCGVTARGRREHRAGSRSHTPAGQPPVSGTRGSRTRSRQGEQQGWIGALVLMNAGENRDSSRTL